MRNDLGRVCLPGTIQTHARRVLALPTLLHAEQQITGTLSPTLDAVDLMDATFPARQRHRSTEGPRPCR